MPIIYTKAELEEAIAAGSSVTAQALIEPSGVKNIVYIVTNDDQGVRVLEKLE